jgi:hypothetical protein
VDAGVDVDVDEVVTMHHQPTRFHSTLAISAIELTPNSPTVVTIPALLYFHSCSFSLGINPLHVLCITIACTFPLFHA